MISHIKALGADVWGKSTDVIALIDNARKAGVKITASQYPYTASGTSVTAALVPRWAEAGGALLKNLNDSSLRPRLVTEIGQNLVRRGGADTLLMTASPDPTIVGKTLAVIARERHESPVDAAIEIVKSGGSDVASFNMKDSDIEAFMRQPWVMTCSDGSPGHPRKYGTYPRKLRLYVYEKHIIPLEFAIRSSTSLPAETLGLKDRGLLKPGYFADVLVFDPRTFNERATYQAPAVLSTGVQYLAVNGQLAIDNGGLTPALAGRALKH
jgi:N-acyl-D-aspartate/D-glutamate deacylase